MYVNKTEFNTSTYQNTFHITEKNFYYVPIIILINN